MKKIRESYENDIAAMNVSDCSARTEWEVEMYSFNNVQNLV